MSTCTVLKTMRAQYQYPDTITPFLSQLRQRVKAEQPYQGLRILNNTPLTFESFLKIETLIAGGASVVATTPLFFPNPKKEVLSLLNEANIPYELDHQKIQGEFDFHLDCGAELYMAKMARPKKGSVELTQSGTLIYQAANDLSYPVISVDDSELKKLETVGTGMAFVLAFEQLTKQSLQNKKVMLFGAGKIGQGVLRALKPLTQHVVVVEANKGLIEQLLEMGYTAFHYHDQAAIKEALKDTFCVVTACGDAGCISRQFKKEDFSGIYLANLSVTDDYGDQFSKKDVLADKLLINFVLDRPTPVHYIDPVLYAHNLSLELILTGQFESGYHPFPDFLAKKVINEWENLHQQKLSG